MLECSSGVEMLRASKVQLLTEIASQFSLSETQQIGVGSPGVVVPRDVYYCKLDVALENRQEFIKKWAVQAGTAADPQKIMYPFISFYCTNVVADDARFNKHLGEGIGIATEDEETDEISMIPFIAEYQIDHFSIKDTDHDAAIKNWLYWKLDPWFSFTDVITGIEWKLPILFEGSEETSDLEDEYEGGAHYRWTFLISVRGFAMRYTTIDTIQTILWSVYNLDGSVTLDSGIIS